LQFSPGAVSLGVANGRGSGQAAALGASGGGYGLQGMRERVLLLGGTVETGPSGEGWLVVATVPA
jgi:signal transduction histidine kinase